MKPPRFRADVIAGPHPEDPDTFLLYDTVAGRQFEMPADGWRMLSAFDGRRSIAAIAKRSGVTREVAEGFEARLLELGLLTRAAAAAPLPKVRPQWSRQPVPDDIQLVVHPDARFECSQAGSCCRSGYVIPLDVTEAARVRRAALRVLGPDVDPVGMLPTGPGAPWTYALDNDDVCPFLDAASSCRIHRKSAYPPACRIFPFLFARVGSSVHVSIAHRCVCGAGGTGRRLASDQPAIRARLTLAERIAVVPDQTFVDHRAAPSPPVVQAIVRATHEKAPWDVLLHLAESLAEIVEAKPSRARGVDDERLCARLRAAGARWKDPIIDAALARAPHPDRLRVHTDLKRSGIDADDGIAECLRFVRDHLFGLRVYHYEAISHGLLALGLATRHILDGSPNFAVARERIMLWEEALTTEALPSIIASAARGITHDIRRTGAQLGRLSS